MKTPLKNAPTFRARPHALIGFLAAMAAAVHAQSHTVRVTTLADSGPGSLREAVGKGGRRVEFAVGGEIRLAKMLVVVAHDLVVDGTGAPAPGVTVSGRPFAIDGARNVTLRNLRFRMSSDDNLRVIGACRNILIENCSSTHGGDGAIDITEDYKTHARPDGVTIRNCVIAATEKAMLVVGADNLTLERNLFTNNSRRNPQLHDAKGFNVVNNHIRNFAVYGLRVRAGSTGNVVGNLIPLSPLLPKRPDRAFIVDASGKAPRVHTAGNRGPDKLSPDKQGNSSRAIGRMPSDILSVEGLAQAVESACGARPLDRIDAALVRDNPAIEYRPSNTKDK